MDPPQHSVLVRASSAVFFGVSSIIIVFINKILLTNLRFPSFFFVGVGQMAATILILQLLRLLGQVSFPACDASIPRKVFPLPLIYALNLVTGLGGTQMINLPMFTVLRRFSIAMTMGMEYLVLGVIAPFGVRIAVLLMVAGSVVAALYDLTFNLLGYTYILFNDICTASQGVYMKKKLDAKELGKDGLLYYNCLFMLPPSFLIALYTGDIQKANDFILSDEMTTSVWFTLMLSFVCGFMLNYALILCTHYNSALTTTCVGPIKNLIVTYAGMFSSGDFVFSWLNVIGINISVIGSILYTYVTFRSSAKKTRVIHAAAKKEEVQNLV